MKENLAGFGLDASRTNYLFAPSINTITVISCRAILAKLTLPLG